jgi:chromosomal replication initiator protein
MYQLADPENQTILRDIRFILKKGQNVVIENNVTSITDFIEDVMNLCAMHFGVQVVELKGNRRDRDIKLARQLSQYIVKEHASFLTLSYVGMQVAGKNHATVLHSIKSINNIIEVKDKEYFPVVQQVVNHILLKWKIDSKQFKSKLRNL